jgi:hypothetical protein
MRKQIKMLSKLFTIFRDATIRMVDKKHTSLFHCTQSLNRHNKQLIRLELQDQHKAFYFNYKNSKLLEKANIWSVISGYYQKLHMNFGVHELGN